MRPQEFCSRFCRWYQKNSPARFSAEDLIFKWFLKHRGIPAESVWTAEEPELRELENAVSTQSPDVLETIHEMLLAASGKVRKKSGSFYTPYPVVEYMAGEALICHIRNFARNEGVAIAEEELRSLFAGKAETAHGDLIAMALETCTVMDPACGSGAFILGTLKLLSGLWEKAAPAKTPEERFRRKVKLLEENFYGADIQKEALEITRMRCILWLWEEPAAPRDLPSVKFHLTAGDSLKLTPEKAGVPQGFDIVIGNPPYVSFGLRGSGKLSRSQEEELKRRFPRSAEYKIALYALFMELAVHLCKTGGVQSFIVPDSFLAGRYFSKVRSLIIEENHIAALTLLDDPVFKATVGRSVIYLFQKGREEKGMTRISRRIDCVCGHFMEEEKIAAGARKRFRLFFSSMDEALVRKIEADSRPLGDYVNFSSGMIGKAGQRSIANFRKIAADWKPGIPSGGCVTKFFIQRTPFFIHYEKSVIKSGFKGIDYSRPKILLRQTGDAPVAALDLGGLLVLNNLHVGLCRNSGKGEKDTLKILLCLLNSSLFAWYYRAVTLEEGRVMAQLDLDVVHELPVKFPGDPGVFLRLYEELIQKKPGAENALNRAVFQLYGVDPEEIRRVE